MGRGLRPARHRGLTSPDPVRTPTARAATRTPDPGPGPVDKPQNQSAAGKTRPETAREGKPPQPPHSAFSRWIEAKCGWSTKHTRVISTGRLPLGPACARCKSTLVVSSSTE